MAKKRQQQVGDFTILEIERELKKRIHENIGDENYADIQQLKDKRSRQIAYNRKSGQQKRRINEKLKKGNLKGFDKKALEHQRDKLFKFDTKKIDNEIKQLSGEDFVYTINTKFGKHKIKSSTLMKKENIAKFIVETTKRDLKKKKKKTDDFENIEKKINYNLKSSKVGYFIEEEEYEDEINETDPPILVDIIYDTIILKL